jgi:hypothetical protein
MFRAYIYRLIIHKTRNSETFKIVHLLASVTFNAPYSHYIIQTRTCINIPLRHSLSPIFLFCAYMYDSSVFQNFKIFIHILLPIQSVPITTDVVSSNHAHGEVYSIQHYVIKFINHRSVVSRGTPVSSTNKTDCDDIAEILLTVALSIITLSP